MRDHSWALRIELENFIAVLSFKRYLSKAAVKKADIFPDKLRLTFSEKGSLEPAALIAYVVEQQQKQLPVRLHPPAVLELPLQGKSIDEALYGARALLAPLLEPGNA